jgi:hypothetical protein
LARYVNTLRYLEQIKDFHPDYNRIIFYLNEERCPDCLTPGLAGGRRRSLTKEIFCRACGAGFAVAPYHFDRPPHQFHFVRRLRKL